MAGSAPPPSYPQDHVVITQPVPGAYPSSGFPLNEEPLSNVALPFGAPAGPTIGAGQLFPLIFMPPPAPISGAPAGLEYLAHVDGMRIHQQVEVVDMISPYETPNRYQVKNNQGQLMYWIVEESKPFERICCSADRGFVFHVLSNAEQEVMRFTREFSCCGACCNCCTGCVCLDCCSPNITVEAPVGNITSYIQEQCGFCSPTFTVKDFNKRELLSIDGGNCGWNCCYRCCARDDFKVSSRDGDRIGRISKLWTGCVKDLVTPMDHYGLSFPKNLDVKTKAALLGAAILIDFKYYYISKSVPRKQAK